MFKVLTAAGTCVLVKCLSACMHAYSASSGTMVAAALLSCLAHTLRTIAVTILSIHVYCSVSERYQFMYTAQYQKGINSCILLSIRKVSIHVYCSVSERYQFMYTAQYQKGINSCILLSIRKVSIHVYCSVSERYQFMYTSQYQKGINSCILLSIRKVSIHVYCSVSERYQFMYTAQYQKGINSCILLSIRNIEQMHVEYSTVQCIAHFDCIAPTNANMHVYKVQKLFSYAKCMFSIANAMQCLWVVLQSAALSRDS